MFLTTSFCNDIRLTHNSHGVHQPVTLEHDHMLVWTSDAVFFSLVGIGKKYFNGYRFSDLKQSVLRQFSSHFELCCWLSHLSVRMTNVAGSRSHRLPLIIVNSSSNLMAGQNIWLLSGLCAFCKLPSGCAQPEIFYEGRTFTLCKVITLNWVTLVSDIFMVHVRNLC